MAPVESAVWLFVFLTVCSADLLMWIVECRIADDEAELPGWHRKPPTDRVLHRLIRPFF